MQACVREPPPASPAVSSQNMAEASGVSEALRCIHVDVVCVSCVIRGGGRDEGGVRVHTYGCACWTMKGLQAECLPRLLGVALMFCQRQRQVAEWLLVGC